jgi:hypothetical protein
VTGADRLPHPRDEYPRRLAERIAALARGERRHLALSNARLAVAALFVFLLLFGVFGRRWSAAWAIVPAVAFAGLAIAHALLLSEQERRQRARIFYEHGLARMDGTWLSAGAGGRSEPGPPGRMAHHPYASDLDLFGDGSLFQLLDTARTEVGEQTLGRWLSSPADPDEIRSRQEAVAELRGRLDFREAIAVLAAEAEVGRTDRLIAWASSPPAAFATGVRVLFAACAVVTVALAVAVFADHVAIEWLGGWVFVQSAVAYAWKKPIEGVIAAVGTPENDLLLLVALLERIEREPFTTARLAAIAGALSTGGEPASRTIGRLRGLVSWLDATFNLLFAPVAFVVLLRSQLAIAIDRWHQAHRQGVLDWLRAVGELEALAALATFGYEHPAYPFPEIADGPPILEAAALAHPLLAPEAIVPNDLALGGSHPHVLIVSGSNMSGKSTLLRAVGVNVVLALAGAPVCARSLRLSMLRLGATIRVDDSLQEGHSRFYAEILRIRDVVRAAAEGPVLFLLDEILHGTNSYDRRIGAEAIVQALVRRGGIGLVTTHDLALTELTARLGQAAANVHFEDRLEDGRMVFDYRMRPGVVERSNALALMRAVGIEI